MLEDFNWFQANYKSLQKEYGDCFIVIKNKSVIGTYETYAEAVYETKKVEIIGTFIVQECHSSGEIYHACIASTNFS